VWAAAKNNVVRYSNSNANTLKSFDSTVYSWAFSLGGGADVFRVYRAAATSGTPSFTGVWTINNDGSVSLTAQSLAPNGNAGAPSYSFTDRADTGMYWDATNARLVLSFEGADAFRVDSSATADLPNSGAFGGYKVGGTKIIGTRKTGYTNAITGTANRATSYDTSSITLVQLAQRVKALQDDLTSHGLIGA
jgi:hypothetical protein